MKIVPCWIACFVICGNAFGQELYPSGKLLFRPSIGIEIPLGKSDRGYVTDKLTPAPALITHATVLSAAYFFGHWGIDANLSFGVTGRQNNRPQQFIDQINAIYTPNYYTDVFAKIDNSVRTKGMIGPVYKIEHGRFIFIAGASVGVNESPIGYASASLKGRDTNEKIDLVWSAKRFYTDVFTFNPSATFAYRFRQRLALSFRVDYWIYKNNYRFTEEKNDSGVKSTMVYRYSKATSSLGFSAGLMIIPF